MQRDELVNHWAISQKRWKSLNLIIQKRPGAIISKKLQKLMDRTVENILTALIEICGTVLTQEGISCESYGDVLKRTGELFSFSDDEQGTLAKLAIQRNRLAHRYLNFRWQVMKFYSDNKTLIQRLVSLMLEMEVKKQEGNS